MTDTTTRLLRTWERFEETHHRGLYWAYTKFRLHTSDITDSDAHAIAGWRLLELLRESGHAVKFFPHGWFNDGTTTIALRTRDRVGPDADGPTDLDALISAYWAAKGEQEPSP